MLHALSLAEVDLMTYPWLVTMATMSADNKKVPPVNLAAAEKEFLLALALKSQAMIKNKKSNKVTVYLSWVQNSNNNELSSSVIAEFYLTGR